MWLWAHPCRRFELERPVERQLDPVRARCLDLVDGTFELHLVVLAQWRRVAVAVRVAMRDFDFIRAEGRLWVAGWGERRDRVRVSRVRDWTRKQGPFSSSSWLSCGLEILEPRRARAGVTLARPTSRM